MLRADAELASRYAAVVGGTGVVSDDEFWEAHLDALVDAATAHARQALPSLMPDELQAEGSGSAKAGGAQLIKLDRARMATIFLKEPVVHAALLACVTSAVIAAAASQGLAGRTPRPLPSPLRA